MRDALPDRELNKFVEVQNRTVVQVTGIESFSPPPETDAITTIYPDTVTEVYEYRTGGIAGTILRTVTVVYVDATKAALLNAVVT